MAQLTLTIPDDKLVAVQEAFVAIYGPAPAGTTANAYVAQCLTNHIRRLVAAHGEGKAAEAARKGQQLPQITAQVT